MNESCRVESVRDGSVAVLRTDGYINREGGEEIERCIQLLLEGGRFFYLTLQQMTPGGSPMSPMSAFKPYCADK